MYLVYLRSAGAEVGYGDIPDNSHQGDRGGAAGVNQRTQVISCDGVSTGFPGDTEGGDQVPGVPAEERRREESCQQAHGVRG